MHPYINATISIIKKLQYDFPKMRGGGGGSKAVWIFSENSSDLVPPSFPHLWQCYWSLGWITSAGIQYKLGKHYMWKKVTQPWELNLGPTPIQGELSTIIVSVFSWSLEADNSTYIWHFNHFCWMTLLGWLFVRVGLKGQFLVLLWQDCKAQNYTI